MKLIQSIKHGSEFGFVPSLIGTNLAMIFFYLAGHHNLSLFVHLYLVGLFFSLFIGLVAGCIHHIKASN